MATTSLSLGEHWEVFIKNEVASGRYGSASEVVRDALRTLEERKSKLAALRSHLAEGAAQAERSEFVKKEIRQRIKNMFIAWSPGERDFSAGHVADFYEQTEQYFAFDTLMPATSIMKGWQSFADNWELALTKLNNFRCELKEIISLEVRGDVAWTGLRLAVSANEIETGRKLDTTQQVTLIWEKQGGTWRIMHEHLSGPVRM